MEEAAEHSMRVKHSYREVEVEDAQIESSSEELVSGVAVVDLAPEASILPAYPKDPNGLSHLSSQSLVAWAEGEVMDPLVRHVSAKIETAMFERRWPLPLPLNRKNRVAGSRAGSADYRQSSQILLVASMETASRTFPGSMSLLVSLCMDFQSSQEVEI